MLQGNLKDGLLLVCLFVCIFVGFIYLFTHLFQTKKERAAEQAECWHIILFVMFSPATGKTRAQLGADDAAKNAKAEEGEQ